MTDTKLESIKNFSFFSHRGFGEKAYARYFDTKRLRFVHNQLSGLELGIENGGDTLEIDLSKTKDGKIVTAHGIPFQKSLLETEQEYLGKHPEALKIQELLDWIFHQPSHITLYLELKSPISINELLQEIEQYAGKNHEILNSLYKQLMIYTPDLQIIKNLIKEKQQFGFSTLQLRIFWVSMGFITNSDIDMLSQIGTKECRVYGVEQGTVPWGFKPFVSFLYFPFPPFLQIKKRLQNLKAIVVYAHEKNLQFIVGTVDDTKLIKMLIEQGINGIVPNNPSNIYAAGGIKENNQEREQTRHYIPPSMKQRLLLK